MYDEGGVEFRGEAAGAGALYGVREGLSKEVTGGVPPNQARSGGRGVGAGRRRKRQGQWDQDFQDGISCKVRAKALPSRRV